LIDTKQGLFIEADLGDSHVVFANHTAGVEPKKGSWSVKLLSKEHKPDDPEEKKRIEAAGGELNYTSGIARVGGVSMSRALGDVEYKKPKVNRFAGHNFSDVSGMETGVAPGATVIRDLVSNTAHFTITQLQGQSLIMLASDGVGDPQEATENAQLAVAMWQGGGMSLKEIAEALTKRAGAVPDADNCTVLLIVLDTEFRGKRKDSGNLEIPKRRGSIGWGSGQSRRSSRSSFSSIKGSLKDLIG
jgi:serine/threonine protein phosphatase PrpC